MAPARAAITSGALPSWHTTSNKERTFANGTTKKTNATSRLIVVIFQPLHARQEYCRVITEPKLHHKKEPRWPERQRQSIEGPCPQAYGCSKASRSAGRRYRCVR